MDLKFLVFQINKMRKEIELMAQKRSFTDEELLLKSRQLSQLITAYQRKIKKQQSG